MYLPLPGRSQFLEGKVCGPLEQAAAAECIPGRKGVPCTFPSQGGANSWRGRCVDHLSKPLRLNESSGDETPQIPSPLEAELILGGRDEESRRG